MKLRVKQELLVQETFPVCLFDPELVTIQASEQALQRYSAKTITDKYWTLYQLSLLYRGISPLQVFVDDQGHDRLI